MGNNDPIREAADLIAWEMRNGFLHPGVLAPGSKIHSALTTLIESAQEDNAPIDALDYLDKMNADGRIEYSDYSNLHDLISLLGDKEDAE